MTPEINFSKLPSVAVTQRNELPSCPAVYFLMDGDTVLYIGKTINLRRRWEGHDRLKQAPPTARIFWLQYEGEDLSFLSQLEASLINRFNPVLNGSTVKRKQPLVAVEVTQDMLVCLKEQAKQEGRSLSNMTAALIVAALRLVDEEGFSLIQGKLRKVIVIDP